MSILNEIMNQAGTRSESIYERRTRLFGETYARNNKSFADHMSDGIADVKPMADRTAKAISRMTSKFVKDIIAKSQSNKDNK